MLRERRSVEATVRYAAELGYEITMVKDATADRFTASWKSDFRVGILNFPVGKCDVLVGILLFPIRKSRFRVGIQFPDWEKP